MKNKYLIANFGEIFLKGKNIRDFEKRLLKNFQENLGNFLTKVSFERKSGGSFWIKLDENLSDKETQKVLEITKNTPGFASFYLAYFTDSNLESLKELAKEITEEELKKREIKNFGIFAERLDKGLDFSSKEAGKKVGSAVWDLIPAVNLSNPDLKINIKIRKEKSFIFTEVQKGVGGLPVGSSGKAVAMFSGGIDSPVAAFLGMKRGLEITAIHFHSVPKTSPKSIDKVKSLVNKLKKYQKNIKLILVPILDIQEEIAKKCDSKLRLVLLRRSFLKIAQKINQEKNLRAKTYITGDSLGQVASQTTENMIATGEAVDSALLFRPLIAFDKLEIIELARKIETYKISILPHEDSCSMFTPKNPETKANLSYTLNEESKINSEKLVEDILKKIEIIE